MALINYYDEGYSPLGQPLEIYPVLYRGLSAT